MAKKQVRNGAYYEERLKREFPAIYSDFKAGKYRTVTEASVAAGIKQTRTRLHELKNAWTKASGVEKREFLNWLIAEGALVARAAPTKKVPGSRTLATSDRHLTAEAIKRIKEIMAKRHLKMGDVMFEMGFSKLNASLGMALQRNTQLQPDLLAKLEKWLVANSSV
ncbi:hypothetical protein [Martelella radicis]|uniref:Site-specific recombinase XerC n=1 Tax=Martelella radicis TaxID=1397476 RepID=A0A7W6PB03_9HYPH|nr:hypothetical protein [Martelella radicis]MBB4122966.1 site-specific recombinase XerC [Martelella radicis]